MAIQNNKPIIHRKEWQFMTPVPSATGAGAFTVKDPLGERRVALYVNGTTSQWFYDVEEDGWYQLPSFALAGTFAAGSCGGWGLWSNTLTATGGTTTTINLTTAITGKIIGRTVWFQSASTNTWLRRTITNVLIVRNGTNIIYLDQALPIAVANGHTFKVDSGVFYVLNAYTAVASGVFKSYDQITGTITTLTTTGLPAAWGTDGRIVSSPSYVGSFATGTATSATSTTLVNSAKTWTTNQWSNYQVRITAGTGIGQVRNISSNTGTTLTVSAAWSTTLDATSQYAIEGNDDYLYLIGNGVVTMYRYSISANTFTTLSPTAARAAAPGGGMSANWVGQVPNNLWKNESDYLSGRFIYSFRGAGTSTLHRYDIALNTWATYDYIRQQETFTTGSCYDYENGKIYILKENTGRLFRYDVVDNEIIGTSTDLYPQSTAVVGDKIFTVEYYDGSGDRINFIYYIQNTSTIFRRLMVY
jgi:hypothetical protein